MNIRFCYFVIFLSLVGCSSAPTHYYTLVPATDHVSVNTVVPFQYSLLTINVPPQADQPQIVVRQGEGSVQILETERWAAPLADEVRAVLGHELRLRMGRVEATGLSRLTGLPHVSIQVDLRRFESVPGDYALIEAAWSLRKMEAVGFYRTLICSSVIRQKASAEVVGLVLAHQKNMSELSTHISQTLKSWMANSNTGCSN